MRLPYAIGRNVKRTAERTVKRRTSLGVAVCGRRDTRGIQRRRSPRDRPHDAIRAAHVGAVRRGADRLELVHELSASPARYIRPSARARAARCARGTSRSSSSAASSRSATSPTCPTWPRLEWASNAAYHAADAPTLNPARIAAVPQDRYAQLTFVVHPSVQLFASTFPTDRIWQAHQPGGDLETKIDLTSRQPSADRPSRSGHPFPRARCRRLRAGHGPMCGASLQRPMRRAQQATARSI